MTPSSSSSASLAALPEEVLQPEDPNAWLLLCREDVYAPQSRLLLLKAGQVVTSDMLPKLMQFGVTPQQFELYVPEESGPEERELSEGETQLDAEPQLAASQVAPTPNSLLTPPSVQLGVGLKPAKQGSKASSQAPSKAPRPIQSCFIYEPTPQALSRLLKQLDLVGVHPGLTKATRSFKVLEAFLQKRTVDALFLSVASEPKASELTRLLRLYQAAQAAGHCPSRWVLMPPRPAQPQQATWPEALKQVQASLQLTYPWELLYRPVSYATLKPIIKPPRPTPKAS